MDAKCKDIWYVATWTVLTFINTYHLRGELNTQAIVLPWNNGFIIMCLTVWLPSHRLFQYSGILIQRTNQWLREYFIVTHDWVQSDVQRDIQTWLFLINRNLNILPNKMRKTQINSLSQIWIDSIIYIVYCLFKHPSPLSLTML